MDNSVVVTRGERDEGLVEGKGGQNTVTEDLTLSGKYSAVTHDVSELYT